MLIQEEPKDFLQSLQSKEKDLVSHMTQQCQENKEIDIDHQ